MYVLAVSLLAFSVASASTINLPAGAGPYGTSLATSNFTDHTRNDPYAPNKTARNLMLSIFTPVPEQSCQNITTPYMPALSAAFYDQVYAPLTTNGSFEAFQMNTCSAEPDHSITKYPRKTNSCHSTTKHPLLIFSPGAGNSRLIYNLLAQSIASHGYTVITVDHPYSALFTEYPDGSSNLAANLTTDADYEVDINIRGQDIIALANTLINPSGALNHLISPPAIDLSHVYVAGHSLGGATALSVLSQINQFRGGANLDGKFFPNILSNMPPTKRPFLLVGNKDRNASTDDSWHLALERNIRGPWAELQVEGWEHGTFTDLPMLLGTAGFEGYIEGLGDVDGMETRTTGVLTEVLVGFMRAAANGKGRGVADLGTGLVEFPEIDVVGSGQGHN